MFLLSPRLYLLAVVAFASTAIAVQPLDEKGLQGVSADAGQNILNLYGASAAGLTIDNATIAKPGEAKDSETNELPLSETRHQEGDEVIAVAEQQIDTLEESLQALVQAEIGVPAIGIDEAAALLSANTFTLRQTGELRNNTELRYQNSNFNHRLTEQQSDSAMITRDLLIERLSLENLKADSTDAGRSAGSLYISDWSSRGGTRITAEQ